MQLVRHIRLIVKGDKNLMNMNALLPVIACCVLVAAPASAQKPPEKVTLMTAEEALAAGLLDRPPPQMDIPLDELVSKEDFSERANEHLARVAEYARDLEKALGAPVQVAETVIPPGLEKVLDAVEAGDDDRLREVLSDMIGTEVPQLRPTAEQRRLHDATAVYKPREGQPPDEVLARMRPDRVEALADHRHLLDDPWKLIDALSTGDMSSRERSAMRVFLSKSRADPVPIEARMPPEMKEEIARALERGWHESHSPALGVGLLRQASQLELAASSLSAYDEHIPGTTASYSFNLPGDRRIEVVADTVFGGVLYAEKSESAGVHYDDPNLHILGHDGSLWITRHADGVWSTNVGAFDGSHKYKVTVEKKLEGEERDEFVRMATAMIEEDLSRFPDEE